MIKTKIIKNKRQWERLLNSSRQVNFLQSWYWGEANKRQGYKIFRLGYFNKQKLVGISLLIKKVARRGTFLVCPGGPIINWSKLVYFKTFALQLKKIGEKENCDFARVRPQIADNLTNQIIFKNAGFRSAPMHLHAQSTWQLKLNKSEEALLKDMRKTTRYLIRKAIKENVKIVKSSNPKDVDLLYQLQLETAQRQSFVPFPKKYLSAEFKAFFKSRKIKILKAYYQKQLLAIAFIVFYGREAVYHYSASSSNFPKIPATYLLIWEAIKEAKKRKLDIFNFWGISPNDDVNHRFSGVSLFKKGFGGFRVNYLPAQDLAISLKYWLTYIFENLRKLNRNL
jgi:peptidoglycan pentaglycine glycine transferase (the first glycine)